MLYGLAVYHGSKVAQRSSSSMKSMYLNITFLKLLYYAHERGGRNVQSSSGKARFLSNSFHGG